jgi:hypothetical protein
MAEKFCFLIGELGPTKSPERARAAWLHREIIEPVLSAHFPEYEIRHAPMVMTPQDVQQNLLADLYNADLVIADITNSSPTTMYQLGVRHLTKLPIVHLTSTDPEVTGGERIPRDFKAISFVIANKNASVPEMQEALKVEIQRVIDEDLLAWLPTTRREKQNKLILAERIERVATEISRLRINSATEYVEQLRTIATEAKNLPDNEAAIRAIAGKVLSILSRLLDTLGTNEGAQILIAGAVTGILGAGGWPSAIIFGLSLAVWQGKEAFLAALGQIPKTSGKKTSKRRKKS